MTGSLGLRFLDPTFAPIALSGVAAVPTSHVAPSCSPDPTGVVRLSNFYDGPCRLHFAKWILAPHRLLISARAALTGLKAWLMEAQSLDASERSTGSSGNPRQANTAKANQHIRGRSKHLSDPDIIDPSFGVVRPDLISEVAP